MDVAIPTQEAMTPEAAYERLERWFLSQGQLKKLKAHEHLERTALAEFYFRNPKEGTNRFSLGGGYDLKLQAGFNYKVTNEDLDQVKAADIKKLKLPWDDLFKFEPKLVKSVYNGLSKEQKDFVDQLLEITDASPQMEIVPAADRAGQAEHAAAAELLQAEVARANAAGLVIATAAEEAQPGHYYNDGDTWWQLGEDIEWVEVEDADTIELLAAQADAASPAPAAPKRRSRKAAK